MPTILPDPTCLRLDQLCLDGETIIVCVAAKEQSAACPLCAQRADRVHSRYVRTLADLPWNGVAVRLHLRVRRFFCETEECKRSIFAEQLPSVAARYARRTTRLTEVMEIVGFALGGEAGARVLAALTMTASPDTLLRTVRRAALPVRDTPRVLGIDDFAFRRGKRYGTLLVDLERRCRIDLLPDRRAETVARWLQEHPGVEIISRDRGGAYADGARQGAPDATQVADRFHVLSNLRQAVERLLTRHHACLRNIPVPAPAPAPVAVGQQESEEAMPRPATRVQREQEERRDQRHARYQEVLQRSQSGLGIRAIARDLGMSRHTVRRFIRAEGFPERAPRPPRPGILTPYEPYLRERWSAGCQNAHQLYREIRERGYAGSGSQVRHVLATWRTERGKPGRKGNEVRPSAPAPPPPETLSPRQGSWLLFRAEDELDADERRQRSHVLERCAEAAIIIPLARAFRQLVREFDGAALEQWLEGAEASGVREVMAFAAGIRRDRGAVDAMLRTPWNNGQLEGQVNRLKTFKRTMYGRANFDLLRQRVLYAS
jgi:transposase